MNDIASDYFYLQQIVQGNTSHEQALAIFQEIKDDENTLRVLLNRAYFCIGQKHFDQSIEYYNQALTIARKVNNQNSEAMILESMAIVYFELDQGEKSVQFVKAAIQIYEVLGSPRIDKARDKLASTI